MARRRYKDPMAQALYDELRAMKPENTPEVRAKGLRFNIYCVARYGGPVERAREGSPATLVDAAWAAGVDDRREAEQPKTS